MGYFLEQLSKSVSASTSPFSPSRPLKAGTNADQKSSLKDDGVEWASMRELTNFKDALEVVRSMRLNSTKSLRIVRRYGLSLETRSALNVGERRVGEEEVFSNCGMLIG